MVKSRNNSFVRPDTLWPEIVLGGLIGAHLGFASKPDYIKMANVLTLDACKTKPVQIAII